VKLSLKCSVIVGLSLLLSVSLLSQTVVDATVSIRSRLRPPTSGQAGSSGRKLPIQVALEFPSQPGADGTTNVTFVLMNDSHTNLVIPVSPHPGDFEPQDKNLAYSVQHLHLYLTCNTDPGSALAGGAQLYGSIARPETLLTVLPGESVRVLATVRVPSKLIEQRDTLFFGHATLDDETIKTINDETSEDTQEIGFASSAPYKLQPQPSK